uniref:Ig-like domain-containing protein n=1 Tax=Naja naja TaxID=35670 RepID=A0A8C6X4M2_NAJNA
MFLSWTLILGQTVTQTEGRVTITEGQPIFLNCTYAKSIDYQPSPFWYIQYLGQSPKLFKSTFLTANVDISLPQNFTTIHNKAGMSFHMKKSVSQLNDSAIYFCAVRSTVGRSRRGADQKLAES